MGEYESDDALSKLARLCDEMGLDHMDSEACACETHIFIDAEGNPHECWEASPGHVNVALAMTPEQAVHITDTMAENAKLSERGEKLFDRVVVIASENVKLRLALKALTIGTVAELCDASDASACKGCAMNRDCYECAVTDAMELLGIGMHGEPMEAFL